MNDMLKQAIRTTKKINAIEDSIAKEWFGCLYEELDYDEKELVTYEAYDRLNK